MNYSIVLAATALQEESEAYLYYESEVEGLGERFLKEIENILESVSSHPTYYSYTDETKTIRNVAVPSFPFVIIYQVFETAIVVYNIHHTRKK